MMEMAVPLRRIECYFPTAFLKGPEKTDYSTQYLKKPHAVQPKDAVPPVNLI